MEEDLCASEFLLSWCRETHNPKIGAPWLSFAMEPNAVDDTTHTQNMNQALSRTEHASKFPCTEGYSYMCNAALIDMCVITYLCMYVVFPER